MNTEPVNTDSNAVNLKDIQIVDIFNLENIQKMQDLFAAATGVASIITHPDGTPITEPSNFCRLCKDIIRKTEKGLTKCHLSDAAIGIFHPSGPIVKPCLSAGLWDAGASISVGGKHIANWLIGQVRNEALDEQHIIRYIDEIGADRENFMAALSEVPVMSVEQFAKVSEMLFLYANQLSDFTYQNLQMKMQIAGYEKATASLKESEKKIKIIFDTMPNGFYRSTPEGYYLDANQAFVKMLGYENKDELLQVYIPTDIYVQPVERDVFDRENESFINDLEIYRLKTKDGRIVWIEDHARYIKDENGKLIFNEGICRDITDRKLAEEQVKHKNKELLKLNAEKDKFFSIIAHDLRGPFNSFLGLTRILAEDLPSLTMDEIQRFAISMENSASNLFRLLENLLQWSRMKQGLMPFNREVFAFLPCIKDSIEIMIEPAKSKQIEISIDIPKDLKVFADSNMLQTIIRNLVSNAVKFTPKGGNILLSACHAEDDEIEISVKDSGIGMSAELIDNVFSLDLQTSRQGTDNEPTTGLGLILCKDFIEKHGGRIWIESEEGKGSAFYFTIPAG